MALTEEDLQQIVAALKPVIVETSNEAVNKSVGAVADRIEKKVLKSTQAPKVETQTEEVEEPSTLKGQLAVVQKQLSDMKADRDQAQKYANRSALTRTMGKVFGQDNPHLDVYADRYADRVQMIEGQPHFKMTVDGEEGWASLEDGISSLANSELKHLMPQKVTPKLPGKQGQPRLPGSVPANQTQTQQANPGLAARKLIYGTIADGLARNGETETANALRIPDEE